MYLIKIWFVTISITAIIMTICDKFFAKRNMWRISENALMVVSAFGGALFMYITMLVIRHKTKHVKFMFGLPLIMILHCIFIAFIVYALKMSGKDIAAFLPDFLVSLYK